MKLKRICALAAALALLLSGCSGKDPDVPDTGSAPDTIATAPEGTPPSEVVSLKSEHFTITNDMLAYFFYRDYYDAVTYYYENYYRLYGLDPATDLKKQTYGSDSSTWFDYFMGVTLSNVMNYIYFAEAAYDSGVTLEAEDKAKIEDEIADIKAAAEEFGEEFGDFLEYRFGEGLTEQAIRDSLELYYLSDKQYKILYSSIKCGDGELEEYYSEHKEDFLYVDYRMVEVRADQTEYPSEEAQKQGFAEAERISKYIEASSDISEFVERGVEYYKSINDTLETPLTDDEIFTKVTNIVAEYGYNDRAAFGKWAFSEGRKSGDIVMLDNGAGIYTVYYLQSAPYRKENLTKNYRWISFGDEASARAALSEFKTGTGDGESFEKLASSGVSGTGRIIENTDLGETDAVIQEWLFNEGRSPGDCEVKQDGEQWLLLYFEGDGEVSWKLAARQAFVGEKMNEEFSVYRSKHRIISSADNVNLISGENAFTREAAKGN